MASQKDYDDLVRAIADSFDQISDEDWRKWQDGMVYNGFDPVVIAKALKDITGPDLVFLCAVAVMRGTKITKILERTAEGDVKKKLIGLVNAYKIKDTAIKQMKRDTVTLSRITACFGFTTIATAEKLGPENMGIYHTVCPKCPILGLSGVVLYARKKQDKKILKGHIVIAALITKLVNPAISSEDSVKQAVKYAKAVNGAKLYDYQSFDFIDADLSTLLNTFYSSGDFEILMKSLGINSRDDIPEFSLNPIVDH